METSARALSRFPLHRRYRIRVKKEAKKVFCVLLTILVVNIVYLIAIVYQHSRYIDGKFECVQFTNEARAYFELTGIKTYKCIGQDKFNKFLSHEWLGVDIFGYIIPYEPQFFFFFIPSLEYKNITVSDW